MDYDKAFLKDRAENYTVEELGKLKEANSRLLFQLEDYIKFERKYPLFLLGSKGCGKTFNVRKALIKSGKNYSIIFFKKNNRLELLHSSSGKTETHDYDFDMVVDSEVVVFDDIHYICEAVLKGDCKLNILLNLLENIVKMTMSITEQPGPKNNERKTKAVILISDELIGSYAKKLSNEQLVDLLPYFGEMPIGEYQKIGAKKWGELYKNKNYVSQLSIPSQDYSEFTEFFKSIGVVMDNEVREFLHRNTTGNLRAIVRFLNVFDTNFITKTVFIAKAKQRLLEKGSGWIYQILCDYAFEKRDFSFARRSMLIETVNKFRNWSVFNEYAEKLSKSIPLVEDQINKACVDWLVKRTNFKEKDLKDIRTADWLYLWYRAESAKNKNVFIPGSLVEHEDFITALKKCMSSRDKKNKEAVRTLLEKDIVYKVRNFRRLEKSLQNSGTELVSFPELKKFDTNCILVHSPLSELKDTLGLRDEDFDGIWKKLPSFFSNDMKMDAPFIIAFSEEIYSGLYLPEMLQAVADTDAESIPKNELLPFPSVCRSPAFFLNRFIFAH